jgi:hypothetical protein
MTEKTETAQKLEVLEKARILTNAAAAAPEKTVQILVDAGVIEPKPWWKSLGIGGSLTILTGSLAVLATAVAKFFGYEIDIGATELLLGSIVGLVSSLATWWGRVHAAQPISLSKVVP